MKPRRRLLWFVVSTVVLGALLGGVYGQRVEATTDTGDDSDVQSNMKAFTQVYDLVESNYADPIAADKAIYGPPNSSVGAIPGMLRTLDPHSNFFDPRSFDQLREEQEGKYYGVGMTIETRLNRMGKLMTYVVLPIPGSPAFKVGLRPGDAIIQVNGKSTEGLQVSQVADMLKGPKGTVARVSVTREGSDQPLQFTITRDQINRPTVDDAFLIRPGVAYIHINGEDETTNDELTAALKRLDAKDLRGMVLDLRNNPGGLLNEAVDVSDHFLQKDQLIVYHYGRRSREQRYYAQHGEQGNEYPMVVLINRNTASAAEIISGALQDHDRALIMGEPSFGKGLVQTVYPLSEHAGLALTTAHYYTPSGRLIQRDYDNVSLYDYYYRPEDSPTPKTQVRLTDGGREVYGGGGITPDVEVAPEKLNPVREKLEDRNAWFSFGEYYLGNHSSVPKDFQPDETTLQEFEQFLAKNNIPVTHQEIEDNLDYIKSRIRLQIIGVLYGTDEASRISAENDPLVMKAIDSLPQAAELINHAKKYMAAKEQQRERASQ
ncbi:MAG TPA: S41 family peptidase [Terriglobia bacterium]|nr:S41 family peptidase [Terriglobia bacterium]